MKSLKAITSVLVFGIMMFAILSCSEENPVYERSWEDGPTDNGQLNVYAKIGTTSTYCGSASVKLYKTQEDRNSDNYYMQTITDPIEPATKPAIFANVEFDQYIVVATWYSSAGQKYMGAVQDLWVPKGKTTTITISML